MAQRYVYGIYDTFAEAEDTAGRLVEQGVPQNSISLVANTEIGAGYTEGNYDFVTRDETVDDRNWFEKLFGLGEEEDYEYRDDYNFPGYEDSLRDNKVLLVLDQEHEGLVSDIGVGGTTITEPADGQYADGYTEAEAEAYAVDHDHPNHHEADPDLTEPYIRGDELTNTHLGDEGLRDDHLRDEHLRDEDLGDNERIQLHEEVVDVDVRKRDAGEVEITKRVVEDVETVEVPVEREEIHIRHVKPTDETVDGDEAFTEEVIDIPVTEEEIVVDKETRVVDEVEIERRTHTDYETVEERTRREELEVNDTSDRVFDDEERLNDEEPLI